jgi:hypothetical protein
LAAEANPVVDAEQFLHALREALPHLGSSEATQPSVMPQPAESSLPTNGRTTEQDTKFPVSESAKPFTIPLPRQRRFNRSSESYRPSRPELASVSPTAAPAAVRRKMAAAKPLTSAEASAPVIAQTANSANSLAQLWPLWILLGAVLGGGLRLVPLTTSLLPIFVGLGVALLVVVVLSAMAMTQEHASATPKTANRGRQRTREPIRASLRSETRKENMLSRLASLTASSGRSQRDSEGN